jgi:integrase
MKERQNLCKVTKALYGYVLGSAGDYLNQPNPATVTLAQMTAYESSIKGRPNTKACYCAVVKTFLVWCGNRQAVKWRTPSMCVKTDGIFLSEQTVEYVRQVSKRLGTETELLYSLAVDNGCRIIDMVRMTTQNAKELLSSGMTQIRSKGRNGGKLRPLVLNQMTFEPLTRYLRMRESSSELLFDVCDATIANRLEALSDMAKVEFRPHDLRRTFGNRHWRAGTPIETIARLMGHESVDMTFRAYIGVQMDDMLRAQRNLVPSSMSQQVRLA